MGDPICLGVRLTPARAELVSAVEGRLGAGAPLARQAEAVVDQRDRLAAKADQVVAQRDLAREEATAWRRVVETLYAEAGYSLEAVNDLYREKLDELRRCWSENPGA